MKLSEIFRTAQQLLCVGPERSLDAVDYWYSCDAIWAVLEANTCERAAACAFAEKLGCPIGSLTAFAEFGDLDDLNGPTEASQQARLLWLEWCALMIEEEGL